MNDTSLKTISAFCKLTFLLSEELKIFDFNSIIHVMSHNVIGFINKLMISFLNNKTDKIENIKKILDSQNNIINDFNLKTSVSKQNIIKYFI